MATSEQRLGGFGAVLGFAILGATGAAFFGVPGGLIGGLVGLFAGGFLLGWFGRSLDRAPDYRSRPRGEEPRPGDPPYAGLEGWERPASPPPEVTDRP
jgi:hypothetical protein